MKKCSKCGEEKQDIYFGKDSKQKLKLKSWCKQCVNTHLKKKYWDNPTLSAEIGRIKHLKKYYGISNEEYLKMFDEQKGCCAICNISQTELKKKLFVDHCHNTGKVRGLLCRQCNSVLGYAYDNVDILTKSIEYLKK